mmetsp:Transcript_7535/g.12527  ORF Transcript_7535/g.12527 Transcript_7535/m.12527 type:complete len:213 (+) Transcript_7535:338-976(+)
MGRLTPGQSRILTARHSCILTTRRTSNCPSCLLGGRRRWHGSNRGRSSSGSSTGRRRWSIDCGYTTGVGGGVVGGVGHGGGLRGGLLLGPRDGQGGGGVLAEGLGPRPCRRGEGVGHFRVGVQVVPHLPRDHSLELLRAAAAADVPAVHGSIRSLTFVHVIFFRLVHVGRVKVLVSCLLDDLQVDEFVSLGLNRHFAGHVVDHFLHEELNRN